MHVQERKKCVEFEMVVIANSHATWLINSFFAPSSNLIYIVTIANMCVYREREREREREGGRERSLTFLFLAILNLLTTPNCLKKPVKKLPNCRNKARNTHKNHKTLISFIT